MFIDCERGTASLTGSDVTVLRAYDWEDLQNKLTQLERIPQVEVLYIDTLTEICEWAKESVLRKMGKSKEEMSQYEWVQTKNKIQDFIRYLRDLPKHVIITAHTKA